MSASTVRSATTPCASHDPRRAARPRGHRCGRWSRRSRRSVPRGPSARAVAKPMPVGLPAPVTTATAARGHGRRAQTLRVQPKVSGAVPFWIATSAARSFCVTGPTSPLPTRTLGAVAAHQRADTREHGSGAGQRRFAGLHPLEHLGDVEHALLDLEAHAARAMVSSESRVTPCRNVESRLRVRMWPSRISRKLAAPVSCTDRRGRTGPGRSCTFPSPRASDPWPRRSCRRS